jgi:hypothetical protein
MQRRRDLKRGTDHGVRAHPPGVPARGRRRRAPEIDFRSVP